MGGGSSKISEIDESVILNSINKNCEVSTSSVQSMKNVKFKIMGDAKCGAITFKNKSMNEATCNINGVTDIITKKVKELSSEQKTGLLSFGTSKVDVTNKSKLETYLNTKCKSTQDALQEIDGVDVEITDNAECKRLEFINSNSLQANCYMKEAVKIVNDINEKISSKQEGFNFTMLAIIAVCVLLVFLILKFM